MLQQKIDHIHQVVDELEDLKIQGEITGITKIVGDGIKLCLTSDLSEAIANYYTKHEGKSLRDTTVDQLLLILENDLIEKKELLEKEKLLEPKQNLKSREKSLT